jgi:hypothetical protein
MKSFEVEIKGKTPYMQHRMDDTTLEKWEKQRGWIIERPDVAKEDLEQALYRAYVDAGGNFFIPSEQVRQAMIAAGTGIKAKMGNSKRSMKNIVAGMFNIREEKLPLNKNFVIDKRSAVNQNNKARIISIRPKWENWETSFVLEIDNDTITEETIKQIICDAGNYVGIGSYRPQKNGKYGRFEVTKFVAK